MPEIFMPAKMPTYGQTQEIEERKIQTEVRIIQDM